MYSAVKFSSNEGLDHENDVGMEKNIFLQSIRKYWNMFKIMVKDCQTQNFRILKMCESLRNR